MKMPYAILLVAALTLTGFIDAAAAQISKSELQSLKGIINGIYSLTGAENIDVINSPMSREKALSLGIYYVYNFEDTKVRHIANGPPVRIYKDAEPLADYALVSVKSVASALDRILGYKLSIDPNAKGKIHDYLIADGNFIIGESDPGADAELNPISAERDDFGYLRVVCEQMDLEDEKKVNRYYVVAKDHIVDGQKSWKILLLKEIR